MRIICPLLLLTLLLLLGCPAREAAVHPAATPYVLALPPGFPEPEIPADNQLTAERVALGRKLFHAQALSRDSSLSCATCHVQARAFTDGRTISRGIEGRMGLRNTPTLVNLAYQPYFFAEGGSPTLELQSMGPIKTEHEMDLPIRLAVNRLAADTSYQWAARRAYGRPFDAFVLTRALAAFQRTFLSGDSPYDRYVHQGQAEALTPAQQRGMRLFFSDTTGCGQCHRGINLTDYQFHNVGLYADDQPQDLGRYRVSADSSEIGAFKTPSLRNVALTAPYMHDGSLPDLPSVIEHFDRGGQGHRLQPGVIRPLHLSARQKADLLAFLEALTDTAYLRDPAYQSP